MVYCWDAQRWVPDIDGLQITRRATDAMRRTQRADETGSDALRRWALESLNRPRINAMVELARKSKEMLLVAHSDFNADPWLLNVANGTVNLRTGQFHDHRREDYITKLSPVDYSPNAACPRWEQFIKQAMNDDEQMVSFMQRYAGMLATGSVDDQLFWVHFGEGNNGKSVFFSVLQRILGDDYATVAPPKLLVARRGEAHPTEIMELRGRRMVVAVESDRGAMLDMGRIKWWTSSEPVKARAMCQDFVSWRPTHKLALQTNHKPRISDASDGAWRRIRLVPWLVTVPENQRIASFDQKLFEAEAPGILAWMVRGAIEYASSGLQVPKLIMEQTQEYRQQQDQLADFIQDCCEVDREVPEPDRLEAQRYGYLTPTRQLMNEYHRWCEAQKLPPLHRLSAPDVKELLTRHYRCYEKVVRYGGGDEPPARCIVGLRFRNAASNLPLSSPEADPAALARLQAARNTMLRRNSITPEVPPCR